jgi:hypothetical protein
MIQRGQIYVAFFILYVLAVLVSIAVFSIKAFPQIAPGGLLTPIPQSSGVALGSFLASGGASNTTTFAGVSFGAADPTRYVVVVGWVASGSTFSGMTIGGISATNLASSSNGVSQLVIAAAAVPTGTTGNIVFTYSGTGTAIYSAYRVINSHGTSTTLGTSTTNPINVTPVVPAGSFVIGAEGDAATGTRTWTGVTQDANQVVVTSSLATASKQFFGGGSTNLQCNGTNGNPTFAFVAMTP